MKNNNKSSFYIAVVCVAVLSVFVSSSAFGWGKGTHAELTKQSIEKLREAGWLAPYLQNNLGLKRDVQEKLPYKRLGMFARSKPTIIADILTDGARQEDEPVWRAKNHFHSPIINSGLHQPLNNGESALAWARGDSGKNEYSWAEARKYYKEAFEALEALPDPDEDTRQAEFEEKMALTFASLGQVMHLIQDMAVPAHTRNDMQGAGQVSAA